MLVCGEITNPFSHSSHIHPFFPTFSHYSPHTPFSPIWHTMKPLNVHIFNSPIFNQKGHKLLRSKQSIPIHHLKKYTTYESNMRFLEIIKDIQQSRDPSILIVSPQWQNHVKEYTRLMNIRNLNTRIVRPENLDRYLQAIGKRYEVRVRQ